MKSILTASRFPAMITLLMLLIGTSTAVGAAEAEHAVQLVPANFSRLAKDVKPSVVNISTVTTVKGKGNVFRHYFESPRNDRRNPFEEFWGPFMEQMPQRDYKQRSLGSGFIIDAEGYIVTNNHVVGNADQIKVKLSDENEYDAELVGRDPKTDLALIKITAEHPLRPISMGDSDALTVGEWVVAVGSPFGLEQTVTAGIVSAKGRIIGFGPYEDFIQTDASINPGNSGGPLINMRGEVVGINTAIVASGQGIGFAIPVNLAENIISQLKSSGEVTRGWLGVGIQNLTPELAAYYGIEDDEGVLVTQVFKGDPAEKGGIKPNDIIVSVDDQPVSTVRELSGIIANTRVGKRTAITFIRDGENRTVTVELAKRDDDKIVSAQAEKKKETQDLGLQLMELTRESARQYGFEADEKGILIASVARGSKAEAAGLRQGDLIKEINRHEIDSLKDFEEQIRQVAAGQSVQFLVKRPREGLIVASLEK